MKECYMCSGSGTFDREVIRATLDADGNIAERWTEWLSDICPRCKGEGKE